MNKLKENIEEISGKTDNINTSSQVVESLKQEFEKIIEGVTDASTVNAELEAIKISIDTISSKASKIDSLGGVIDGLKQQFETVSSTVNSSDAISLESIRELGGKIDSIETEISSLVKRADSTAFVGENLKVVQEDFHKKSEKLFEEIQSVRNVTNKASSDSSKEIMALLKLSEYQSNIRMNTESKYGDAKDIEKMAKLTTEIINLFDKISDESDEKIPLPHEMRQWAVSKMLDCADRWEIRFSDVYSILTNAIGRDMLKEAIRIQQVRDIYGIRAVDEIRNDLNIS